MQAASDCGTSSNSWPVATVALSSDGAGASSTTVKPLVLRSARNCAHWVWLALFLIAANQAVSASQRSGVTPSPRVRKRFLLASMRGRPFSSRGGSVVTWLTTWIVPLVLRVGSFAQLKPPELPVQLAAQAQVPTGKVPRILNVRPPSQKPGAV